VSYRSLKRQFALDDAYLDDLRAEIIEVQQLAVNQEGTMLVWTGDRGALLEPLHPPGRGLYSPDRIARTAEAEDPARLLDDSAVHRRPTAGAVCQGRPPLGRSDHPGAA
jgi:hypothetical protein